MNDAVIEATPYEDLSMILFLTKFSSLNAFNAPVEKLKTKNRNEIAVIKNCTGNRHSLPSMMALQYTVCHFALHDNARKEVKRVAKMLNCSVTKKITLTLAKKCAPCL